MDTDTPKHGKSKFTLERKNRVLNALRAGNTLSAAAKYAGVSPPTVKRWMEDLEGFADEVSKAEADAEVGTVAVIRQAMPKSWQAAAWWLERRRGDEWRMKQELDVNHNVTIGDLFRKFSVAADTSHLIETADYDKEAAEIASANGSLDDLIDEAEKQMLAETQPPIAPQQDEEPDDTIA